MYFKSLEIVGFKSFMSKTKLKFEPGVTTIVGPNGCGKSNVVDAIKWVLGEQSPKSMRSSIMQDVIFNGTEKYDPLNMSEVSLTFSNEDRALSLDYDEVTVSRRLFRSGESCYFLNKTPVRLTDVKELLMGTGIGTSAYSIVEQGRLDLILNAKPEDRRHVFEEASGITKFRAKKREALLKLEHTRNNLTRITDIIHEVERQIKAIERQARKAEKYKEMYNRLKDLDVKLSYKNFKELKTDDSSLNEKNGEMKGLSERLKEQLDEASGSLIRQREEYNRIMRELQESQGEVMRLSSEVDKNKHVITVNGERTRELERYSEQLNREIEKISGRKEALYSRLEKLQVRCLDVGGQRQTKEKELAGAEGNVKRIQDTVEQHRAQLKTNRENTVDIISEQTQTKNRLIRINADIQNMVARERRLRVEKSNVEAEKDEVSEELGNAEEKAELARHALEEKRKESQEFNNAYSAKQQELFLLNEKKKERESRLNEIRPQREFLEKLISEREGIGESVKEIMKRVETGDPAFSGVHGILSEIISVGEGYEESLEFLLGDISQAIVVDSRSVACSVVRFLEESLMSSVSFLILDEVEKRVNGRNGISFFGRPEENINDVTRVLTGEEKYRLILSSILRDVSVSDASGSLIENHGSLTGKIIGKKGEIRQKGMYRSRNHSQKETVSLFGRKEKAKQLRAEEEDIKKDLTGIGERIKEVEEWLKEATVTKERIESELRERQMQFADAQSKKEAIKEKMDAITEELLLLDTELQEEIAAIKELRQEGEQLNSRLNEIETENSRLQQLIEESQKIIQEGTHEREKALYCISDVKAELSALRKEDENLADNLNREKENYERVDSEVQEKQGRITDNGQKVKDLEEEIRILGERNIEHDGVIRVRTGESEEKRNQKDSLERTIAQAETKSREAEEELESVRNKVRDLDILKKETEYKRDGLVEKILSTYKVDLSGINIEVDEIADWERIQAEIEEIKAKLERMGEVSLGAVDEHKELKERYEFLVKQKDDLVKGADTLMQAITKINRTTRKMFVESFEAVRNEFQIYFKMLFNGGKADLVLTDETNILESGVDIVARPPGKKLQNISLLSGGEKAMTAIALVFALFKVNPSPFCILDEIDAPLDESNVVRFSRVLQEFLKTSQFIIVTHNRTTIRLSDILYGVTMQEKGVSKIVSVKFADEEEILAKEDATVAA
ncbi:MAG: chromosome segregation protein SMC [Candidatus Omnitrophota bacterium]